MTDSVRAWRVEVITPEGRFSPFHYVEGDRGLPHDRLVEEATVCRPQIAPGKFADDVSDHDIPDPDCTCGLYAVEDLSEMSTFLWVFEQNQAAYMSRCFGHDNARYARHARYIILGGTMTDPMESPFGISDSIRAIHGDGTAMQPKELDVALWFKTPILRAFVGDPYTTIRGRSFEIDTVIAEPATFWNRRIPLPPVDDITVPDVPLSDWLER